MRRKTPVVYLSGILSTKLYQNRSSFIEDMMKTFLTYFLLGHGVVVVVVVVVLVVHVHCVPKTSPFLF